MGPPYLILMGGMGIMRLAHELPDLGWHVHDRVPKQTTRSEEKDDMNTAAADGNGVEGNPGGSKEMRRLLLHLLGEVPTGIRIDVYDGTSLGPIDAPMKVRVTSPDFFHRVITGLGKELAFGRAYVAGDIEIEGNLQGILDMRGRLDEIGPSRQFLRDLAHVLGVNSVKDLTGLRPLPPPPEEIKVRGLLHSRGRDSRSVSSHYDVSNDFYRLFLGSTMTYSCAVFENEADSLDQAQSKKYDLICRKLDLRSGMRLLDIGCGWGGMVMHAAQNYGVTAVGVTISREQANLAAERVAGAGLGDKVEIRLQDYRDVRDGPFHAISSIGMLEHVGERRLGEYFGQIETLLAPGGRLLNHAINRSDENGRSRIDPKGFMAHYVFPDGELLGTGQVVTAINQCGLEVRHVESFREHYGATLRHWVANLDDNWDQAVELTSLGRARVWRLYMALSAVGFEIGGLNLTQVLAVKPDDGSAGFDSSPHW